MTRCPACEARETVAQTMRDEHRDSPASLAGLKVAPFPAARGESVWARYTIEGARWRDAQRRAAPDPDA